MLVEGIAPHPCHTSTDLDALIKPLSDIERLALDDPELVQLARQLGGSTRVMDVLEVIVETSPGDGHA